MVEPATLATAIATQTFGGMLANLASSFVLGRSRGYKFTEENIKTDLRKHFEVTFEKCKSVKTIISDAPTNTLSIYVDQLFSSDNVKCDQFTLIDRIREGESVILTGRGGGGKSMFMRYLWLSYFEKTDSKIPIFFELRHINKLSHPRLLDYFYHSILSGNSSISQANLEQMVHKGEAVIFLDGFDEVLVNKRVWLEQEIIALKENNPQLTIIVTSRPDDRFRGWPLFRTYSVLPLNKDQVIQLINRAQYDQVSKSRLLARISEGNLYSTHKSFLSNPLLAYMMLLTIARNPDIPTKMHLFYEQAFDALFHRHDTTKGHFIRQLHSNIDKQEFISILSFLSLLTYFEERYEFREQQILDDIKKSIKSLDLVVSSKAFLNDLLESVCLVKREGMILDFVHRSFQEYFSANCICINSSHNVELLLSKLVNRNDQVLRMIWDINPDLFRAKFILPFKSRHKPYFKSNRKIGIEADYFSRVNGRFFAIEFGQRKAARHSKRRKLLPQDILVRLEMKGEFFDHANVIFRLGARNLNTGEKARTETVSDRKTVDEKFFLRTANTHNVEVEDISILSDGRKFFLCIKGKAVEDLSVEKRFKDTDMYSYISKHSHIIREFTIEESRKYQEANSSFDEVFLSS